VLRLSGDSEKILNAVICKPHKGMACVLRPSPDIQIFDTGLLSLAAVRSLWEHASPRCSGPPQARRRLSLDDRQFDEWMRGSPDQAVTLLTPYPGMIEAREVGADVGNVKNNRPQLME
jgi:hypothetical protein